MESVESSLVGVVVSGLISVMSMSCPVGGQVGVFCRLGLGVHVEGEGLRLSLPVGAGGGPLGQGVRGIFQWVQACVCRRVAVYSAP